MNAAGWAKTVEHVRKLAKVPTLTHIVMGSFTIDPREGNTGGTNFDVAPDGTAVNSLGLRNGGIPYLETHGPEMVRIASDAGKIPVISIAGFSHQEYATLAKLVSALRAIVELNIGCPNVHDGGKQKEIISYDFAALQRTLELVVPGAHAIWVKPSPYANPADRTRFVRLMRHFMANIDAVVGCNTFPNVSLYHLNGRPYIDVADNYAGMSGTSLKWINLSQCRYYASELGDDMDILGAGGVTEAKDAADYLRVGCRGVQVGAAFFKNENFRVFEEVASAGIDETELEQA